MSPIESLLLRITDRLPCRIIDGEHGEPYLERYYLAGLFGWHVYLHRFVDSDPDRGLHDHPWERAASLVLTGGYDELRLAQPPRRGASEMSLTNLPTRSRHVRPWRLNLLRGSDYHRVVLRDGRPAWTLFLHGPRVKGWGFLRGGRYKAMAQTAADFRHRDWWLTASSGRAVRTARCSAELMPGAEPRPEVARQHD